MASNNYLESVQLPYFLELSYFYSTHFPNLADGLPCQMENQPLYQCYPFWNNPIAPELMEEPQLEKTDQIQAADQTSVGSRSCQIFEKPKRTQAPRFRPTKNNESNISNQAFSYVTNESKSKNILQKFFKNKKKAEIFYDYSKSLNSKRKKYMSKGTLLNLCSLTEKSPQLQEIIRLKNFNGLTLNQFVSGVRFLIMHFLKQKSTSSILTSQKIAQNLKKDHINKVREILHHIEDHLEAEKEKVRQPLEDFTVKLQY